MFDPVANEMNLGHVLNDTYPHTLARNLAKELGKNRTWKNKTYLAHPRIRVGGYPGFVDCKVQKLVSLVIARGKDDPAVLTVKEPIRNIWGQTTTITGATLGELIRAKLLTDIG